MSQFECEVKLDYEDLLSRIKLRVNEPVRSLLLMQTLIGHAQNSHGLFTKNYPNATLDDITLALGSNPEEIRNKRQDIINSLYEFTTHLICFKGQLDGYKDIYKQPLLSLTLKDLSISDPAAILKGVYLASRMDSFEWRMKTMKKYNVHIGGGECVAVDLDEVRRSGLTLDDLANESWSDEDTDSLKKSGIVLTSETRAVTNKIVSAFVRHKKGRGTSDDLAIVLAGKIYGRDAAMGVFLCDAIDTWDKYSTVIMPGGQDEHLGDIIKENEDVIKMSYPGFELPSDDDVTKFIYTIALQNEPGAVSNSQRYLLQVDGAGQSALESHLNYIAGEPYKPMILGHIRGRVTNIELYKTFAKRFSKNY